MKGAPFLLRRRPQQQRDGRAPSCWSPGTYRTDDTFQLPADDTALHSTLLVSAFGRISSPPAVSHGPLLSGTAQTSSTRTTLLVSALGCISSPPAGHMEHSSAELPKPPPIRPVRSALSQHVALHTSASCLQKPQDRSSTYTFFLCFGAEAYARRATDNHTGINPWRDQRRGLRLLVESIHRLAQTFADGARPTFAGPLEPRAPGSRSSCQGSLLVVLLVKEQVVLAECWAFSFGDFFQ